MKNVKKGKTTTSKRQCLVGSSVKMKRVQMESETWLLRKWVICERDEF